MARKPSGSTKAKGLKAAKSQSQPKTELPHSLDPSGRPPAWCDSMRLILRRDVPVGTLIFEAMYPDARVSMEVARLYTSIDHIKRIVQVLARNLDTYEAEMAKTGKKTTAGAS